MLETNMYKSIKKQAPLGALTGVLMSGNAENTIKIENQLGSFEFDSNNLLTFDSGIVGFHDLRDFALASLPYDNMDNFKLLQSIEVPDLSFIVLPTSPDSAMLEEKDLAEISKSFNNLDPKNMALLFIVTIRQLPAGIKMTMNQRAPVVLDTASKKGRQFILSNTKYSVQHELVAA